MPAGFEGYEEKPRVAIPHQLPPASLKELLETYAKLGPENPPIVRDVQNHPEWSFTELQVGMQYAEYLMDVEIALIRDKVEMSDRQFQAGLGEARINEVKTACQKLKREHMPAVGQMIGADHGPQATALAKRVAGAFAIKAKVDTACVVT